MPTTPQLIVETIPGVTFGAVITGIDLTDITGAMFADIKSALNEHGALVFPAQYLTASAQATFAKRFGSLEGGRSKGEDTARSISNRGPDRSTLTQQDPTWLTLSYPTRHWHVDGSFNPIPPKICILSAVSIPSRGGQTGFADMAAAYDALDQSIKDKIADMNSFHSNLVGTTRVLPEANQEHFRSLVGDSPKDGFYGLGYSTEIPLRPLVNFHPETNRPSLFVGRHAFGISGMPPEESESFLSELETTACRSPRVYEHSWQVGDLVVFDNRRLLHRACPYDDQGDSRELLNSRIAGDAQTDSGLGTEEAQQCVEVQRAEILRLRRRKASLRDRGIQHLTLRQ